MHFKKLEIRNFLPFGDDKQELFFVDNDIVLVLGQNNIEGGSNGAGKCVWKNTKILTLEKGEIFINEVVPGAKPNVPYVAADEPLHVKTDHGWKSIIAFFKTGLQPLYYLKLENGFELTAAADHLVKSGESWKHLKDLKTGDPISTEKEISCVEKIYPLNKYDHCYDIQVEEIQRYYSNGILSHNSSILNAIVWALYGKTTKGLAADEVVNNINQRDCIVSLEFVKNNQYIRVNRYRKLNGRNNKLELFINGKDVSKANMNDTQAMLDDIIKINFRSFISSVMFAQDRVFSFTEASKARRKEIIENILQVDNLSIYEKLFKNRVAEYKNKYNESYYKKESKRSLIDSLIESSRNYIESCKLKSKELSRKILDIKKTISELEKIDINSELEKIKKNNEIEKQINELRINLKMKKNKYADLRIRLTDLQRSQTELQQKKAKLQKNIDKIIKNPKLCPVCGNIIDKEKYEKYLDDKKNELKLLDKSLKSIDLKSVEEELDLLENEIGKLEKSIKGKESKLMKVKYSEDYLKNASNQLISLREQLKILEQQKSNIIDQKYIESIKEQAKKAKTDIKKFDKELELWQDKINHYDFWAINFSKGDNTIRTFLINQVIDFINSRIKHYLGIFFKEEMHFSLDMEMNHFLTRNSYDISLEQLSGGEEQRLNLAIAFSLFDLVKVNVGSNINIIFMDEVLDRALDDEGVVALLKIIEDLRDRGNSIYIISHKDTFRNHFDKTIMVYKSEDGFSQILAA